MRVLICEDEPEIADMLASFLAADGHEPIIALTGAEGLARFASDSPDLVLLDVMLPDVAGWDVLTEIRKTSNRPVVLLTALGRLDDKVKGLSLGADDYVEKPFAWEEVRARIAAVMRRYRPVSPGITVDDRQKTVVVHGREIHLSRKEYRLFKLLYSEPGKVFSHAEIIAKLWPRNTYATPQDVQKYIYLLRRKIEDDPAHPRFIQTVHGFGYRFIGRERSP